MLKCLSLPDLLDELGETNVVGVELVDAEDGTGSSDAEEPAGGVAEGTELALVDVVVDTGGEAHVGVGDEGDAEDTVDDGLRGLASSDSCGQLVRTHVGSGGDNSSRDGKGDQRGGDETLKGPVVRAVGGLADLGELGSVVDGALEDGCFVSSRNSMKELTVVGGVLETTSLLGGNGTMASDLGGLDGGDAGCLLANDKHEGA